jgi:hypothetical protein
VIPFLSRLKQRCTFACAVALISAAAAFGGTSTSVADHATSKGAFRVESPARTGNPKIARCISRYFLANGAAGLSRHGALPRAPAGDGLSYYSDETLRLQPVIAPRGWHCQVDLYGNGSVLLMASPRPLHSNTLSLLGRAGQEKISSPLVTFYFSSVCSSCVFVASCGAITASSKMKGFGPCPQAASSKQRKTVIRGSSPTGQTTVLFVDPPHVKGIGWPSGGLHAASGAVVYQRRPSPETSIATCAVSMSEQHLCQSITSSFVQEKWLLSP